MKSTLARVLVFVFFFVITELSIGQTDPNAGIPLFATVSGSPYDTLDIATGNFLILIPLRDKYGKSQFSANWNSQAHVWLFGAGNSWQLFTNSNASPVTVHGQMGWTDSYYSFMTCGADQNDRIYNNFVAIDETGASHPFAASPQSGPFVDLDGCDSLPGPMTSLDGSGYTLVLGRANKVISGVLYDVSGHSVTTTRVGTSTIVNTYADPDGTTWNISSDGNANTTTYTDTLGQIALSQSGTAVSGSLTYSYLDVNGGNVSFTPSYTSIPWGSNFGCTNNIGKVFEYGNGSTLPFVTAMTSPDGGSYTIAYEPTPGKTGWTTGRIAKITLPTGGSISYVYSGGTNGINCSTGAVPTITRTINDGNGHTSVWTYQNNQGTGYGPFTVNVTDPAGNLTIYTFDSRAYNHQVEQQTYQGTGGTPLLTTVTCYNGNFANCTTSSAGTGGALSVTQTDVFTYMNGSTIASLAEAIYNSYGLATTIKRYDFGAATTLPPTVAPAVLPVTTTTTSYDSLSGPCGNLATYIYNQPCSVQTNDSSGNTLTLTKYVYNSAGHPTQTSRWISGSTSTGVFLTTNIAYNANGTVQTVQDPQGGTTTISYDGSCNSLVPTGRSFPPVNGSTLTMSQSWNCTGGVITSVKDENAQQTSYGYVNQSGVADPYWRKLSTTDPIGNTTWVTYSMGSATPATVESSLVFNGNASATDTLTTFDGLGRAYLQQRREAPGSAQFDTVVFGYDINGRQASTSLPCVSSASTPCTSSGVTTSYDALNRPLQVTDGGGGYTSYSYSGKDVLATVGPAPAGENTKQRQMEYDGLGRLTSVCEITSASGSGSCVQATTKTGYWTKYLYDTAVVGANVYRRTTVTQNAQATSQTRVYEYDPLARLVSETTPESGTKSYFYDSDSTMCGNGAFTSNGDLVKTTDAAGNCTGYYWDVLHRLTDVGNSNQNVSHCRRFRYDNSAGYAGSTKPSGLSNTLGRLIEAATDYCYGSNDSLLTDEWFSYDTRGGLISVYESTPHSGGYYHSTSTYWANGAVNTLAGVPGQTGWTFGVDGEGRLSTAVQGATSLVSNATFNPGGQPLNVTLGLGDSETYTYDPTTARMASYTFTVGATPKSTVGNLTWNANGSLSKLAITDGFNSGGTQTCKYGDSTGSVAGYDDLGRLIKVDCGASVWQQNFSYDPFGNITKTVPTGGTGIAWSPGYNSTNNRYTLGGTSYDANGDLLTDTFHAYTWDVYGRILTIDSSTCGTNGTCLTYDALGRMVEKNVSGTYSEVLYSPLGKTAVMNGSTIVDVYVPLPGGGTFHMVPGGQLFRHADWLGTTRLESSRANRAVSYDRAYAPFGETYKNFGTTTGYNFTGDTQDTVAGTYDTPNRELNPTQGRWLSPDQAGLRAVSLANPQSWNRYSYVTNNSLVLFDASGLQACPPGGVPSFGGGGCNNSGNFPCLICGFSSWDSLASVQIATTPTALLAGVWRGKDLGIIDIGAVPYYGNWDMLFLYHGNIIWSPWYTVRASLEGRGRKGETGLNKRTSYGFDPQTDVFVALPDTHLNGQCVDIVAPNGSANSVPVGDVGPLNGGGTTSNMNKFNDAYWSPGLPQSSGFQAPESSTGTDLRGRSFGPAETGVGIDISYALQQQLGLKGNTTVSWSFAPCQ